MVITRRTFLASIASAAAVAQSKAFASAQDVDVGAIRWDAWYSRTDQSITSQNNLSPKTYQSRAPVHCSVTADVVSCSGDQAVLDAEIRAAHLGGIAFWAFDWFPAGSSFRRAWTLYQSSSINHLVKWCPIAGLGDLGSVSKSAQEMDDKARSWVALMSSPTFYRARIRGLGRPLFFIFYRVEEMLKYFGDLTSVHAGLDRVRRAALKEGVGDPYFVLFNPALDMGLFSSSGADAMSNYISNFSARERGSFSDLDRQVRHYWDRMASTGAEIIPIAQVGWDKRPRLDHPVPWERTDRRINRNVYYEMATPAEFTEHMKAALEFVRKNPNGCASRTVLVYSWDECDEGGCIMPTLGDPRGNHLTALSRALNR
jgi:hypothetical protein